MQTVNGVCLVCKVNRGYRVYSPACILLMPCFCSHICLPASVVVLQPTILLCACCLKSQLFCLDLGSDLDSVICQRREERMALCCLLLMPYPTLSLLSLSLFCCLSPTVFWALSLSPSLLPSVQFVGPG